MLSDENLFSLFPPRVAELELPHRLRAEPHFARQENLLTSTIVVGEGNKTTTAICLRSQIKLRDVRFCAIFLRFFIAGKSSAFISWVDERPSRSCKEMDFLTTRLVDLLSSANERAEQDKESLNHLTRVTRTLRKLKDKLKEALAKDVKSFFRETIRRKLIPFGQGENCVFADSPLLMHNNNIYRNDR